jgi:hypothetical protein
MTIFISKKRNLSGFNDVTFRDVDTIQELTDILVLDETRLLDIGSGLGDVFERVTGQNKFILLGLGSRDSDTFTHLDVEDDLLTQEVTDFNSIGGIVDDDVDGEMSINVTHLVFETLGDTSDHVVDQRADSTDTGNVLTETVVDNELDLITNNGNFNVQVTEVLVKSTTGTFNSNLARLDRDLDTFRDGEFVRLVDILHYKIMPFL